MMRWMYAVVVAFACFLAVLVSTFASGDGSGGIGWRCVWYGVVSAVLSHVVAGIMAIVGFRLLDVDIRSRRGR